MSPKPNDQTTYSQNKIKETADLQPCLQKYVTSQIEYFYQSFHEGWRQQLNNQSEALPILKQETSLKQERQQSPSSVYAYQI